MKPKESDEVSLQAYMEQRSMGIQRNMVLQDLHFHMSNSEIRPLVTPASFYSLNTAFVI